MISGASENPHSHRSAPRRCWYQGDTTDANFPTFWAQRAAVMNCVVARQLREVDSRPCDHVHEIDFLYRILTLRRLRGGDGFREVLLILLQNLLRSRNRFRQRSRGFMALAGTQRSLQRSSCSPAESRRTVADYSSTSKTEGLS